MARLAVASTELSPWADRRRRTRQLLERHAFADQILRLYSALLDVQERAFLAALRDRPEPATLAPYVARHVTAGVVEATALAGPPALAATLRDGVEEAAAVGMIAAWLAGERQPPVDEYLARAATAPVLEALGPVARAACRRSDGDSGCPRCGGPPQVSCLPEAGESLVSAPRVLLCGRCAESWVHPRMTCAGCGEQTTARLPIFADAEQFPQLRADACETCRRYLITVDVRKDPEAVPIVDELVALPLDLYAQERGFAKILPNLMAIG